MTHLGAAFPWHLQRLQSICFELWIGEMAACRALGVLTGYSSPSFLLRWESRKPSWGWGKGSPGVKPRAPNSISHQHSKVWKERRLIISAMKWATGHLIYLCRLELRAEWNPSHVETQLRKKFKTHFLFLEIKKRDHLKLLTARPMCRLKRLTWRIGNSVNTRGRWYINYTHS